MALRPAETIVRWATGPMRRLASNTAEYVSGFLAGEPVPALRTNGALGPLTDWVAYLAESAFPSTFRIMGQGFGWYSQFDTTVPPTVGTPGSFPGVLVFNATSSTQPIALGTSGPITAGGVLGDCIVRYLTAYTGGVELFNFRVDVLDSTAAVVQTYTGTLPDTVSVFDEFTLTPSITPEPECVGPLTLVVRFQTAAPEVDNYAISLDWIELAFL